MFHCSGWTYTWAVTAVGGTHVCLRRVDPALIFPAIARHRVTHMCGAPIVMTMLIHAPAEVKAAVRAHGGDGHRRRRAAVDRDRGDGGRWASASPISTASPRPTGPRRSAPGRTAGTALPLAERASQMARQGVGYATAEGLMVADPATLAPVPRDGATMGEVMLRGNTVMKGYLKNPRATGAAFAGRLVPHRRPRRLASGRLHRDQGPQQGHHHLRRREHLVAGGRGGALQAPGGDGGRRGGAARRALGRDAVRLRDAEARRHRHRRGHRRASCATPSPASRCRATSCSGRCPRPPPARSRSSSCASGPGRPAEP